MSNNAETNTDYAEKQVPGPVPAATTNQPAPTADPTTDAYTRNLQQQQLQYQQPQQPRPFQTGLCDCWSHGQVCICAACCSPCLFGRTHAVFRRQPNEPYSDKEWCGGPCVGYYCLGYFTGIGHLVWQALRRGEIRRAYNLEGSTVKDWAISCCCCPCGMAQEDIEVRRIEEEKLSLVQGYRNANKA